MDFADLILITQVDGVLMTSSPSNISVDGTLCITGHHLILSSRKEGKDELWLMHQNVDVVERKLNTLVGGSLILKCKDFRIIRLDIFGTDELNKVATTVESIISLNNILLTYAFFYRSSPTFVTEDGWTAFRPEIEYNRLIYTDEWRVTHINENYEVCSTYPNLLIVPKNIDDDTVTAAAKFREGGRFPVLSYRHSKGTVLLRSSQPLISSLKRCKDDERLLNAVLGPGKRGYIIDTRSQNVLAYAKSHGGGTENECNYPQWRRIMKPLDRYSGLLDSVAKLIDACNDKSSSVDRWSSKLESSNWLSHIKEALNCACLAAQCLDQEGCSVLIHGLEGKDATLLICSVTQIILNPDCRTIRGFQALIERDWLQAGHPFQMRHSRGCYSTAATGRNKNNGASFLLFLDCVYQLTYQFACSFEFSSSFLICLYEHSYSSQYGTFLGNSESDREMLELADKTLSLWSYINQPDVLEEYLNPMYAPNLKIIWPSVAPMSLVIWRELYFRWVIDLSKEKAAWNMISKMVQAEKDVRQQVLQARKELDDIYKEMSKNSNSVRNQK